jgi:hypothetical protein
MQPSDRLKSAERMTILYRSERLQPPPLPDARITVSLHETLVNETFSGDVLMRLVFSTTLTVDVSPNDNAIRKAFHDLITNAARQAYGPACMLAKSTPAISIMETSRDGSRNLDLFEPSDADRISRD